jgi:hypothetical protein
MKLIFFYIDIKIIYFLKNNNFNKFLTKKDFKKIFTLKTHYSSVAKRTSLHVTCPLIHILKKEKLQDQTDPTNSSLDCIPEQIIVHL